MLKINNRTPLDVKLVPYTNHNSDNFATIVAKGTFNFKNDTTEMLFAEKQIPLVQSDQYFGEVEDSSIKYESDLAARKVATDIVLIGHAISKGGEPCESLDVTLAVNRAHKTVRVFGNRYWERPWGTWKSSAPEKFVQMPLRYENAFGGGLVQTCTDEPLKIYGANPVGKGFLLTDDAQNVQLPNLENPRFLTQKPGDQPTPAGFGFIGKSWLPRLNYAGTYDNTWEEQQMPLLPLDFDERYYNGAHPDFIVPLLSGGETISVSNVSEQGLISFNLPTGSVQINLSIKGKVNSYRALLDTVVIEPDEQSVSLTWRVTAPCYRNFLYIKEVDIMWTNK